MSKAQFSQADVDAALVDFLENADLEMVEFKSDKNPGVTYKVTMPDGTEIKSENA